MRQLDPDGAHIWLRQSVTFTADDQTRTVEIAIPLPRGASPDEVEALLTEAGAGMDRLTRHLDARVAAFLTGAGDSAPAPAAAAGAAAEPVTPPPTPASREPAPALSTPAPARPSAPPAARSAPQPPAAARVQSRAEPPAPAPAVPLALPEFIAAAQTELGLNPRQAMEKLGVKTLSGLNLREALEMLRRQALRDGDTPAAAPAPAASNAGHARPAAAAEPPRYFEEEDDEPTISFTDEQDDDEEEADLLDPFGTYAPDAGPAANGSGPLDDLDDLDDVPDFGPPPTTTHAAPSRRAQPAPAATPPPPPTPTPSASSAPGRGQAARIISELRAVRGGGVPSGQQRMAFRNIVIRELGEPDAKAITQGLWRLTPDKLGPEQIDALVSWGKRETFADEADLVLHALRAERAARDQSSATPSAPPEAVPPSSAPARHATRGHSQPAKPPGE